MMTPLQGRILLVSLVVCLALLLVLWWLPALLHNYCWIDGKSCLLITYRMRGGELLVQTQTGYTFWYNGLFIYDYNDRVPFVSCQPGVVNIGGGVPGQEQTTTDSIEKRGSGGSTGTTTDTSVACLRWQDGTCKEPSPIPIKTAMQFPGKEELHQEDFVPCFTLDASTMTLVPEQARCAIRLSLLAERFKDSPVRSFRVRVHGDRTMNIYEIFAMLERRNIFKRPAAPAVPIIPTPPCVPVCTGKFCGEHDGCNGYCSACKVDGYICDARRRVCCATNCDIVPCGDKACDGTVCDSCPRCPCKPGFQCGPNKQCTPITLCNHKNWQTSEGVAVTVSSSSDAPPCDFELSMGEEGPYKGKVTADGKGELQSGTYTCADVLTSSIDWMFGNTVAISMTAVVT